MGKRGVREQFLPWRNRFATMKIRLVAIFVLTVFLLPVTHCRADSDGWYRVGQALGIYAVYKQTLTEMLELGNDPFAQTASRIQDIKENGSDTNPLDIALVDRVMQQLTTRGVYELKINSLPFVWAVNNSDKFNASCYPTNYISINRGLVRGLNLDADELAAVLAHEMTHGLEQHSAHKYAEVQAEVMGMTMLGMETGQADWRHFQGLIGYSVAKDILSPAETEADEGGFWLMTGAGFNPGGAAAAMARMSYYLRYQTEDIYEFDTPTGKRADDWQDHPDTEIREKRLGELMTLYSGGHVRVVNRREVWLDDTLLYTAGSDGENSKSAAEKAYCIAGALAKAFHDYSTIDGWNFRQENGRTVFLSDTPVYAPLREALINDGEKLLNMVRVAYGKEKNFPAARNELKNAENKNRLKLDKIKQEFLTANKKFAAKLRQNSDAYVDLGNANLALWALERAKSHPAQNDLAECLTVEGRIYALKGDFTTALELAQRGIELDGQNYMNYLNLSDIYHVQGDFISAIKAAEYGLSLKDNDIARTLCAELYEETGNTEKAQELRKKQKK